MRVLVGMPDRGSLGGPGACEPPFVAELRRQGVEVEEETYVYGESLKGTGAGQRVRRVLSTAARLRRKMAAGGFDLVHLNTSFDTKALLRDAATVKLLGRTRARIFLKFHGSDADLLKTDNALLKACALYLLGRADGLGVLSSEEGRNFVAAGVDAGKVFVVKNVVEREFPAPEEGFNVRAGLEEGVPVLLFIGRFIPAKGLLDVLRACARLRDGGRRFALLCVGDGPARAEAEAEAARLALSARVRFTGYVPEERTAEFYANAAALVFPTYHYEGFPMVIFYAAAAGLPLVTTRIRAAADYLAEPDNCLWVEPRDPVALAEKIALLLDDDRRRAAMGENNRRLARAFQAAAVTREYLEAYRTLVGGRVKA